MEYEVQAQEAEEMLKMEDVKIYLRTLSGDTVEDDAVLAPLITAAREFCEYVTGQALAKETIAAYPEALDKVLRLPIAPAREIVKITATDDAGETTELPPESYTLMGAGCVYLRKAPATRLRDVRPIEIVYEAGYAQLPKLIRQAMLLLIGHW